MVITDAASQIIREWLRASAGLSRPTIFLGEVSDVPAEVTEAEKRGVGRGEVTEIAKRALKSQPRRLYPLIYPGYHFVWLSVKIDGFRFASPIFYSAPTRYAMKNGILDAFGRSLVLKDKDGNVVLPTNTSSVV